MKVKSPSRGTLVPDPSGKLLEEYSARNSIVYRSSIAKSDQHNLGEKLLIGAPAMDLLVKGRRYSTVKAKSLKMWVGLQRCSKQNHPLPNKQCKLACKKVSASSKQNQSANSGLCKCSLAYQ